MTTDGIMLRNGGQISVDSSAIYIDKPNKDTVIIREENVQKVSLEVFNWSLAIMSLVTAIFGLYFALVINLSGGILFSVVGLWSIYRTYTKRYTLFLWIDSQAGPIKMYPEQPKKCHAAIVSLIRDPNDRDS